MSRNYILDYYLISIENFNDFKTLILLLRKKIVCNYYFATFTLQSASLQNNKNKTEDNKTIPFPKCKDLD